MIEKTLKIEDTKSIIKFEEFKNFIIAKNKNVSIFCHDSPDPDCLASAMAFQEICNFFNIKSTIYYGGEISHTQNKIMINVLNINITKIDSEEVKNDEEYSNLIIKNINESIIAVVDTSSFGKENCSSVSGIIKDREPDIIIDHHNQSVQYKNCIHIYESFGSCSTVFVEMMKYFEISFNKILSTALYLGISTDTNDLNSDCCTSSDKEAFEFLKDHIDIELYKKIFDYPKPLTFLNLRKKIYNNIKICGNNLIISNVGIINPEQKSLIAELCEEILEIESIDSCLVLGIVDNGFDKDKYLVSSFRTQVLAINVPQFMAKIFGKKNSGGRKSVGASTIALDEKTCCVIDHLIQNDDVLKISNFIDSYFNYYYSKIEKEKNNI